LPGSISFSEGLQHRKQHHFPLNVNQVYTEAHFDDNVLSGKGITAALKSLRTLKVNQGKLEFHQELELANCEQLTSLTRFFLFFFFVTPQHSFFPFTQESLKVSPKIESRAFC